MEQRAFGKTDMQVSVLGFGGAELGGGDLGYADVQPQQAERVLKGALDAGVNVIDTAECYGASEDLIGRFAADRRKDYYLFSKVGHPNGMAAGEDWSEAGILASIERSLKRLRTDALDLVHLHSCGEDVLARGEAPAALQKARDKGYTRYIGYSGDGAAAKAALELGVFDSLQTSLSVADQEPLELTLPLAAAKGVAVIAKRPVANAAWKYGDSEPAYAYHAEYWRRLRKLAYPFTRKPLGEAVGEALRFTLQCPAVCTAIVGTANPARFAANAEAAAAGALPEFEAIRARWAEVADGWGGQI